MAWETGSATDYDDLLDKLITFLTTDTGLVAAGQNWTVLKDEEPVSDRYVYLLGPGLAGVDEIHVNLRRFYAASSGAYNWELRGATSYDGGVDYDAQPGTSDKSFLCLSNGTMTYWFFANGRRFMIIAKIGTVFISGYCGFILPYALPSEYPYPLFIGGTSDDETMLYTQSGLATSAFWKGGYVVPTSGVTTGVKLRTPGGFWMPFNQSLISGFGGDDSGKIWPYWSKLTYNNDDDGIGNLTKNLDGSYTLLPIILYTHTYTVRAIFGELDGIFHVPGQDLNSEDTITISADVYLCFQNAEDVQRNDFAAILRA